MLVATEIYTQFKNFLKKIRIVVYKLNFSIQLSSYDVFHNSLLRKVVRYLGFIVENCNLTEPFVKPNELRP